MRGADRKGVPVNRPEEASGAGLTWQSEPSLWPDNHRDIAANYEASCGELDYVVETALDHGARLTGAGGAARPSHSSTRRTNVISPARSTGTTGSGIPSTTATSTSSRPRPGDRSGEQLLATITAESTTTGEIVEMTDVPIVELRQGLVDPFTNESPVENSMRVEYEGQVVAVGGTDAVVEDYEALDVRPERAD